MLMIRLSRVGRKNDPYFRVVLTDKRNAAKSGKFLEVLGNYDVRPGKLELKEDRVKYWLSQGAKPSPTMHNFLVDRKLVSGKKINVLSRKSPIKKEGGEAPAPEAPKEEAKAEVAA